jgi:hypothetical protein
MTKNTLILAQKTHFFVASINQNLLSLRRELLSLNTRKRTP